MAQQVGVEAPGPRAPARPSRWAHALGVVAFSSLLIAGGDTFATAVKVALVILASACALDLARREARDPGRALPIVSAIAVLFVVAVVVPPKFSHDLWSYAIAGRILGAHHANPYLHAANAFKHDPLYALVGQEWRHGTTPYGPLFTLFSGGVALVAGAHPLLYRLAFQGSAALAIGAVLYVLWRATRSTSALALAGLLPVITASVVNGGHNDAFIGLGLLLAVISARQDRYARAGWWIAGALLVKATAGLALVPLLAWTWVRGGRRAALQLAAAPILVAVPVMLVIPGMMHSLNSAKTNTITRASIWNLPLRLVPSWFPHGQPARVAHLVTFALLVVIVLVVGTAWIARRIGDPAPGVVAATAAWLIFGAYVLPWYTVWALPTAALQPRSRLSWFVALQGVVLTTVFVIPRSSVPGHTLLSDIVQLIVPVVLAATLIVGIIRPALRAPDRTNPIPTV